MQPVWGHLADPLSPAAWAVQFGQVDPITLTVGQVIPLTTVDDAAWSGLFKPMTLLMLSFALSGVVGFWLHYSGNVEFEREMAPAIGGVALVREAMMGATPALAPGTMILLAAVGLAFTYRHPALVGR